MSSSSDESKSTLEEKEKADQHKYYKSVFRKFDKDKSGGVELSELAETLELDDEIPRHISERIFKAADRNRNNVLDFEEFRNMVRNASYKEVFSRYINLYIQYVLPKRKHHLVYSEPDALYEEKYTCWPPPIALIIISAIELTLFIINEEPAESNNYGENYPIGKMLIYDPYKREEAWRFLTYMFVHIGYTHLIVNLVVQLFLGFPLEMVHKWRVLTVYFAGVLAGSLGTSVTDPRTYLAGASAGVYALITGHIGTIYMNWNEMDFPLIQLGVFLLITCIDIGTSLYNKFYLELNDNIGYVAHASGAVAGLLVGIWNLKNFVPSRRETYIWWGAVTVYIIFMGILICINIFWTEHFLTGANT
ncbi:rhomboid-related protein 2-like [Diabrotica virgifera virgifera]|uniref:EF-hand domain-containing protein n=1 Tax=Diabrotica virgifera virgifera TaxID=50390 RepID=A0ABM5JQQ7_DIAVI|nr:rhomboid-related protein 2-like [Diabrotica virgifera virgifera]